MHTAEEASQADFKKSRGSKGPDFCDTVQQVRQWGVGQVWGGLSEGRRHVMWDQASGFAQPTGRDGKEHKRCV